MTETKILCNYIMKMFGISLPNIFGKTIKRSVRKIRRTKGKGRHNKGSRKNVKKRSLKKVRSSSRKYKMRGG